jgi:hypothetical protein
VKYCNFYLPILINLAIFALMDDPKTFEVELNGQIVRVSDHAIKSARVLHIIYPNRKPALNITIAEDADGEKFWTSLPEGRQEEAEFAGKIIAAYIRAYRRNSSCATTTVRKLPAPSLFD